MKHVFVIGSKGIPAQYGGFETFVEKLTEGQQCAEIKYHVACLADNNNEFEHNGAHCFNVKVPNIGPAKAVYYDMKAFEYCNRYIKRKQIDDAVVYVLACRIGPFINYYKKQLIKLGGTLYINPDGHEWKRAKWNWLIRKYWKLSEKLMVKHADLLICDSTGNSLRHALHVLPPDNNSPYSAAYCNGSHISHWIYQSPFQMHLLQ